MNREKIAELCHDQWSGWMEYLFSRCRTDTGLFDRENGSLIMPKAYVDRWKRKMITKYHDLTEAEKESDRKEADKFLYYLNLGRLTFDEWKDEFTRICKIGTQLGHPDPEVYREYYEEGYTPAEAYIEDVLAGCE